MVDINIIFSYVIYHRHIAKMLLTQRTTQYNQSINLIKLLAGKAQKNVCSILDKKTFC